MTKNIGSKKGFTLLEILLVVGIIAILAGIVILAINPTKQLGDTRNAQRRSDVLTIMNAIYQYSIDHNGAMPAGVDSASETCDDEDGTSPNEICLEVNGDEDCTAPVSLFDELVTASSTYLTAIPKDPSVDIGSDGTGYGVAKQANGRITVCAPMFENDLEGGITITN